MILITGASSGIGRASALQLALDGHSLVLVGTNLDRLQGVKNQCIDSHKHKILVMNQANHHSVRQAFEELKTHTKTLQGVFANAGIAGSNRYGDNDRFDEIMQTNVFGTYWVLQEALPFLRSQAGYKNVVITASILARMGVPGYSGYCSSKAALLGMARAFAQEWAQDKILVNTICPGWVDTKMAQEGVDLFAQATKQSSATAKEILMEQVLLKKMSTAEEVASLVSYFFSDKQCSITGQILDINNGAVMP